MVTTSYSGANWGSAEEENVSYYEGDTWQHWIGPTPSADDENHEKVVAEIQKQFLSVNLIRECINRTVAALLGKSPNWYLKDKSGERSPLSDEAEKLLQSWYDYVSQQAFSQDSDFSDPLHKFGVDLLVQGEGCLRVFKLARFESAEDAYKQVGLHSPDPGTTNLERDADDGYLIKITYKNSKGYEEVQEQTSQLDVDAPQTESTEQIEGVQLPGEAETASDTPIQALKIVTRSKKNPDPQEIVNKQLKGRWTIYKAHYPSLITTDVKQLQNAANLALTMMNRNLVQAGFLERIISNASLPGHWEDDTASPGRKRFVPDPGGFRIGAGETVFLQGLPLGSPANPQGLTSPSVSYHEPVSIATFSSAIETYRTLMYLLFGLGYLLSAGDGAMSGVSRVQIKQDFVINLERLIKAIEAAIAGVFGTVLRLLDTEDKYKDQEVVVKLRLSLGKLLPEERAAILESYEKGFMSKTTAMALLGDSDDVDSEMALMRQEKKEEFEQQLEQQRQAVELQNQAELEKASSQADIQVRAETEKAQRVAQIQLQTMAAQQIQALGQTNGASS